MKEDTDPGRRKETTFLITALGDAPAFYLSPLLACALFWRSPPNIKNAEDIHFKMLTLTSKIRNDFYCREFQQINSHIPNYKANSYLKQPTRFPANQPDR